MIEVRRLPKGAVGYERIPNSVILDPNISLAELGLLVRLLAVGDNFASLGEVAAAFMPELEPGQKPPNGFGRDAYEKVGKGLERAGNLRRRKGKSAGFGKPGENVTEVSALPFATAEANAQVNTEPGMSGVRIDQEGRAQEQGDGRKAAASGTVVTCDDSVNVQVISETGHSGFRSALAPTCDNAANPQVNSDTGHSGAAPLITDLPPDPPNPRSDVLSQRKGEGETAAPDNPADPDVALAEEAHAILDALPGDRATNQRDRKKLIPAIVVLLRLGWPGHVIGEQLGRPPMPPEVISLGGLMVGWLPPDRLYVAPRAPSPPLSSLPAWCGDCGGHSSAQARKNARFRTLDGEPDGTQCPECHPDQIGAFQL